MNDDFLRNFYRTLRPKGLLTREPGEPPETFEQLQQRALERERAEEAQQQAATGDFRAQGAAPKKTSHDNRRVDEARARARQDERRRAEARSSRREAENPDSRSKNELAKAQNAVHNAERIVRRIEREFARAEADVRRWKAQGKILKRTPIPKVPVPIIGPLILAGRLVLEYLSTPSNLEAAQLRVERWSSALPLANQHLEIVRERLRQSQE